MSKVIYMPVAFHPKKTSTKPTIVIDLPEYRKRKLMEAVLKKHREER